MNESAIESRSSRARMPALFSRWAHRRLTSQGICWTPCWLGSPLKARPIWTGRLSFGLLNEPVSVMPGEQRVDMHFRMLDSRSNTLIRYERVNADTGDEVPWKDIVKAYEYKKGSYAAAGAANKRPLLVVQLHHARRQRKSLLQQLIKPLKGRRTQRLGFSEHVVGHGEEMLAMVMKFGLEGVVSKRVDAVYRAGRSGDWLKIKRLESDEFAGVGYTKGKGSRQGFGSLLLGRPSPSRGWNYAGRVGSGFTDARLEQISKALSKHPGCKRPTVHAETVDPLLRDAQWVRPRAVVEVYYRGPGGNGLLRQPSLKAWREDKNVTDLGDSDRRARSSKAAARMPLSESSIRGIVISHPDREVYPGISKLDIARYYDTVMDWFLPGVKGRPLSILRCPGGIQDTCFFQKHPMPGLKRVGRVPLKESSGARRIYLCPADAESIIELVQFGVIEFHPWGGLASSPERADRIVFDLDPGDDVSWNRVIAAARLVRKLLGQLSLAPFVRTTGGKGMHVVVPLRPAAGWDDVEGFSRAFAMSLAQSYPDEFIAVSSKARRGGLIFFDYLRNSRGATSVASYSLRARAGAPAAVPLRWEELGKLAGGGAFDIQTLPARLKRLRRDPWEGFDSLRQSLKGAVRAISG